MALLITAFSLFVRLGFAMFVVDFAHKLHFQVRLVKDECHAVAHHKNSAETMSTEGRFNSSLSKSSGWS